MSEPPKTRVFPMALSGNHHRPTQKKNYGDYRPNDFASFREMPESDGVLRLIIGRIVTADGHDLQDDVTVPIEEQFMHEPLEWLLKCMYCPSRGIPNKAKLNVKFMLREAGADLGWLDTRKSPADLKLKDSDIVEVLVTRFDDQTPNNPDTSEHGSTSWSSASWQEAVTFLEESRRDLTGASAWLHRVWSILDKYAEDDNVVRPALDLLLECIASDSQEATQDMRCQFTGEHHDRLPLVQRILEAHSQNTAVQVLGWALLAELAKDPELSPLLAKRHGVRALARRSEKLGEAVGEARASIVKLLERLEAFQQDDVLASSNPVIITVTCSHCGRSRGAGMLQCGRCKNASYCDRSCQRAAWKDHKKTCTAVGAELVTDAEMATGPALPSRTAKSLCSIAGHKLQGSIDTNDTMAIDKVLRQLLSKMRSGEVDCSSFEEARLGTILEGLRDFEGDADVRKLAREALVQAAQLSGQLA